MFRIFIIISISFVLTTATAQSPCLPEGITFTTQGQIDDFQVNYPGCSEIEGNVIISGGNISSLEGLSVLTAVYGDLYIGFDPSSTTLTSLTGLDNLQSVGGTLSISNNEMLTGIEGLSNLTFVGNDLLILQNEKLNSLAGLEGIDTIPGNLIIRRNYLLETLETLQGLTAIGGDLRIMLNPYLADLHGLEGITSIPGDLVLFNQQLVSLDGLDNLTSIGGNLQIGDLDAFWNIQLGDLSALLNLAHVGGVLAIYWNQVLESLAGLDNIDGSSIQHMEIIGNPMLSDCDVQSICDYLSAPNGTTFIGDNATGCNSIDEVEEACETTATKENNESSLEARPNPAENGMITFVIENDPGNAYLHCFNMFGQEVYSARVQEGQERIIVSSWQAGIYIAVVYQEGQAIGRIKFCVP